MSLLPDKLCIYIFSFNRGRFLENCLESVKKCAKGIPVRVIDDNSTCTHTKTILDNYAKTFNIIKPGDLTSSEHKTGGLYSHMRFVLEKERNQFKYLLFLQDDMQLVRPITEQDLSNINEFFELNPNSFVLQTCFLKRIFEQRDKLILKLDGSKKAFIRSQAGNAYSGFSAFSAVGVYHIEQYFQLMGKLEQGEYRNNETAFKKGLIMGLSRYPFMMWLPFPKSNRGKSRSYALQCIEYIGGCGFYPYDLMDSDATEKLLEASPNEPPIAEDYLISQANQVSSTWSFAGGISNLRARSWPYIYLSKLLDAIRKFYASKNFLHFKHLK